MLTISITQKYRLGNNTASGYPHRITNDINRTSICALLLTGSRIAPSVPSAVIRTLIRNAIAVCGLSYSPLAGISACDHSEIIPATATANNNGLELVEIKRLYAKIAKSVPFSKCPKTYNESVLLFLAARSLIVRFRFALCEIRRYPCTTLISRNDANRYRIYRSPQVLPDLTSTFSLTRRFG